MKFLQQPKRLFAFDFSGAASSRTGQLLAERSTSRNWLPVLKFRTKYFCVFARQLQQGRRDHTRIPVAAILVRACRAAVPRVCLRLFRKHATHFDQRARASLLLPEISREQAK